MSLSITHTSAFKFAAVAVGVAVALTLVGGVFTTTAEAASPCPYTFSVNLRQGSTGADVKALQQFLNTMSDTQVAASGAGSPGGETSYFGGLTKAAVIKFQQKYTADILTPVGLSLGTGNFFASSRAKANSLCSTASPTPTPGPTPTPSAGTSLTVTAASQPANSIAPRGATRVPFTRFTVTAGADGDVTLNSVVAERTGLASDGNVSGVMLLDENGTQIGVTRTLNSNHQTTVGEPVTIAKGTSKTFTIAVNRSSSGDEAGAVMSMSVVAVNASASVVGSLPIVGANHTINTTLTLGSVTAARGALDPGASQTKEVGTLNYNFSSIKLTAGSAEKILLKSIRWNQTGSASANNDIKNVKTTVDGTSYDTVVSADGKYYTTVFPGNGILIDKGASKDITIKGDIVSGSGRTVDFDIAKRTDIYMVGETFGYGITAGLASSAASADSGAVNNADDYYYDAFQVTVSTGSMTVSVWTGVSAQNISSNQNNQTIAGFAVDVKGEPISVASMVFNLYHVESSGSAVTYADVTNVSLVDQNGTVLAGPKDAGDGGVDAVNGTLTFTDTVTFPVGVTNVTLKAKLSSDFDTNDTIAASTTPGSGWTSVTGQVTGNTITPTPSSVLTGPTMTVKAGALTVSVSSVPIAQTVIAGSSQFEFARYIFDATSSGEDVRITSVPLYYDTSGTRTDLTNCKMYDGTTVLNDSNTLNPSTSDTASSTTLTFSGAGVTIPKGTSKTFSMKCDLRSGATGTYWWGIDAGQNSSFTGVSGLTSGTTIAETFTDGSGQIMTAASGGSLTPALDANSPGYKIVSSGTTGVELARIKYSATNEDIDIRQVALQLSSVASNTPVDLVNREVKLYDEAGTLIGTAVFPTGDNATSSAIASGAFRVLKNGSKVLVIKGDIAAITASGPLTASGDLLVVDYDGDNEGTNGNYGVGVSSGSNVTPAASDSASSGVRIMRGYPVLAKLDLSSTLLTDGSNKKLYRFKVTAVDNDVSLFKVTFDIPSTTCSICSATTSAYGLYAYTDSGFSQADTTFSSTGLLNANNYINGLGVNADALADALRPVVIEVYMDKASATTTYIIPKGSTRYFELQATVNRTETASGSETVTVDLLGDAAFPVNASTLMNMTATTGGIPAGVDADTNDDFIWSPISTTTANTIYDLDFTNGYQVQGLPSSSMGSVSLTSTN